MILLGIDPGLATLGFGVVRRDGIRYHALSYGVLTTPAKVPLPRRLAVIYTDLKLLFEQHRPDAIAVEELFFSRNSATAMAVAQARGVILLAAQQTGLPMYEFTPMQIKQAVCGYGHADKTQVQWMIQRMLALPEPPKPDDAADALAMAIALGQNAAMVHQYKIN